MQASVIVPVWNGAAMIGPCLDAVFARSGARLAEVLCVDNGSRDDSAHVIRTRYPDVRLLSEPSNLGFAGGVNAGIEAARADVLVLLNQDTLVQPGWLDALLDGLAPPSGFGIVGATIFDASGRLNHAGAFVRPTDAEGVHVTAPDGDAPRAVEYVTGAAMAITRRTWNAVGRFDEGYYPAYYEDCDYCYRASHRRIATGYVPAARVVHLQCHARADDPVRELTWHHAVRYRFVAKHWNVDALEPFFSGEHEALAAEPSFEGVIGRLLGARAALHRVDEVLASRRRDLDVPDDGVRREVLRHGFAELVADAKATVERRPAFAVMAADVATTHAVAEVEAEEVAMLQRLDRAAAHDAASPWERFSAAATCLLDRMSGRERARLVDMITAQRARLDRLEHLLLDPRLQLLTLLARYDDL